MLAGDDLLIQIVADYHRDSKYDVDKMKEAIIGLYGATSPSCPVSLHRRMRWTAVRNIGDRKFTETWDHNKSVPDQKVLAKSTRGNFGGFLERFWIFDVSDTVVYRAAIDSCGVRDGAVPTVALHGRVEVQPDVSYKLELKIPSFYKMKRERKGSYDFKADSYSYSRAC